MQIRIGSRKRIQFTDKSHPVMGIISMIIGSCSFILLLVLCIFSSKAKGTSGLEAGVLGVLDFFASVLGFVLAVKCCRKEDIYMITPTIGAVLNGLLVILCMILYVIGAA